MKWNTNARDLLFIQNHMDTYEKQAGLPPGEVYKPVGSETA